jgi:hypothetical protein
MREQFRTIRINFAPVDITGGPGLAVVAVIVAIAFEFPETRSLLLFGIVSGALLAAAMIYRRSRRGTWHPPSDDLTIVPRSTDGSRQPDVTRTEARRPDPRGWRLTPATTPR